MVAPAGVGGLMLERLQAWVERELCGEPYDQADLADQLPDPTTPSELYDMLLVTERWGRAAAAWKTALSAMLAAFIEAAGAKRMGAEILTTRSSGARRLVDPQGFLEWCGDWETMRAVFNLDSAARITVVRQVALERGFDPRTVEETFFEAAHGERVLSRLPVDGARTPAWAKNLRESG